jgi:HSP20 family molecular chaperone IbpA
MAREQSVTLQQKKELVSKEEKTVPARYYVPPTDIYETDDGLTLVLDLPGVEKKDIDVELENDVLKIEARIDFTKYEGLEPLYTEYNVGHFARAFTLSDKIDRDRIEAELEDGVLTLTLKKSPAAVPRRIPIG